MRERQFFSLYQEPTLTKFGVDRVVGKIVLSEKIYELPEPAMALGAYLGLSSSTIITCFGLTIVVRRVAQPYAEPQDDDA